MSTDAESKQTLLEKIRTKRSEIRAFLAKNEPRAARLVNTAIVCSALAAAFTAGPAFGGDTLTGWLTKTLGLASPAWQLLCLGATGCSVAAAIATNLSKSHDISSKILRAQTADAKLEGLETLVEAGQIPLEKGFTHYAQTLTETPFL